MKLCCKSEKEKEIMVDMLVENISRICISNNKKEIDNTVELAKAIIDALAEYSKKQI